MIDPILCTPFRLMLLAILVGAAQGCGESHPQTFAVTGQVLYADGTALPNGGRVIFTTTSVDPPVTATGYFSADGKFTLSTYGKDDGAVAGEHHVAVIPNIPDDTDGMTRAETLQAMDPIDRKYKLPKTSGLKFTISAEDAPYEFPIEVRRPGRRRR